MPAPIAIFLGREALHAAQPEGVIVEGSREHVAVEIDARINHRALAVMALELVQEYLHVGEDLVARRPQMTGRGLRVPFHVESGRQRARIDRDMLLEPADLLLDGAAEII